MSQTTISLTVAAASRDGEPVIDILNGGRDLRVWPTGHNGALITMSIADWDVLAGAVQSAIEAARAAA